MPPSSSRGYRTRLASPELIRRAAVDRLPQQIGRGDRGKDGRLRSSIVSTRVVLLERSVTLASSVFEFCATQDLNYTTGIFDGVLLPQNPSCAA